MNGSAKGIVSCKKNPIAQQLRLQNIIKKRNQANNENRKKNVEEEPAKEQKQPSKSTTAAISAQQRLLNAISGRNNEQQQPTESRKRSINDDDGDDSCDNKKRFKATEAIDLQELELKKYIKKIQMKYNIKDADIEKRVEKDFDLLRKRQKCITYGKVTDEYKHYIQSVPKQERLAHHPKTPNKFHKCSRRKFDGLIKQWRIQLHTWQDPKPKMQVKSELKFEDEDFMEYEDFDSDDVLIINEDVDLTM